MVIGSMISRISACLIRTLEGGGQSERWGVIAGQLEAGIDILVDIRLFRLFLGFVY